MENHYQPKTKGTWGREEAKTAEELNRLCNDFFEKLVVPAEWKDMGWKNIYDLPPTPSQGGVESAKVGSLISVGKIFRDQRTSGKDLKHYRVCFFTTSQRGGIVEKSQVDFGKYAYKSLEHGIFTVEKLNEFIFAMGHAPLSEVENEIDETDGLQSFRDRFSD